MTFCTNIAGYRFVPLAELKPLRERLLANCRMGNLKGTILLSTEGINLFVAGRPKSIDALVAEIRSVPGLEHLELKVSTSAEQPFTRMLVKIKKEIIAFGVEGIDPARRPSPKLSAVELKRWLDEGRPLTLLDTRNDFEVKLGTFANARPIGIAHFREFPEAARKLPEELKKAPVVMFCTGGIRCEKAGPFLEREGFEQVFQLDGGILKYFEECGGAHYEGECFVFDKRVGLEPSLQESEQAVCFACLTPLSEAEQADPKFAEGVSCPYCFRSSEEVQQKERAKRQAALVWATNPLPGSVPYDNVRQLNVPAHRPDGPLLDCLCDILRHVPREVWIAECERGMLLDSDQRPVSASRIVRSGERYYHRQPATLEPDVNAAIRILHEDEAIIVVDKPAPLPVHPSGRFNKNTLQSILREVYAPQKPRPGHRLDANTTGVVVFTRTAHFAKFVQPQFERGEVEKCYLARVVGHPPEDAFTCTAKIQEHAGEAGSRGIDEIHGLSARTDFKVLSRLADGTAILEVRPFTGRTNQIRVHLWHLGWPILGDQIYGTSGKIGEVQTHAISDPPLCLHAHRLTFTHPLTNDRATFEARIPKWANEEGLYFLPKSH